MNQAIGLSAVAYSFGAGIFFVGYALFEIPSNVILLRVGARRWIARIAISGACCRVRRCSPEARTPSTPYAFARHRRGGVLSGYSVLPRPLVSGTAARPRHFTVHARHSTREHSRWTGRRRAARVRRKAWAGRLAMALPDRGSARGCVRRRRFAVVHRTSVGRALALVRREGLVSEQAGDRGRARRAPRPWGPRGAEQSDRMDDRPPLLVLHAGHARRQLLGTDDRERDSTPEQPADRLTGGRDWDTGARRDVVERLALRPDRRACCARDRSGPFVGDGTRGGRNVSAADRHRCRIGDGYDLPQHDVPRTVVLPSFLRGAGAAAGIALINTIGMLGGLSGRMSSADS